MEDCDPPGTVRPCTTSCGTTGGEWCEAYGRWTGECVTPLEVCGNGVDDDCDGIVDALIRLTSNLKISHLPVGVASNFIAWTGSEFAVLWRSFDDRAILTRLDVWGRKVDWDRALFTYPSSAGGSRAIGLLWTGSLLGLFTTEDNPSTHSGAHRRAHPVLFGATRCSSVLVAIPRH
jgi:hypothetical protein